jgi:hypothetical protein
MKRKTKQEKTMDKLDKLMLSMADKKTYKQYLKARADYLKEVK